MCMIYFLENCDCDVNIRGRFIKSIGESKLAELKPYLVDGSFINMFQCLPTILVSNNNAKDIKSILENLGSTYKTSIESG